MQCPMCAKEVAADRLFCIWCDSFIPNPPSGSKAGLFRRWFASLIDPVLIVLAIITPGALAAGIGGESMGVLLAVLTMLVVGAFFFIMFARGQTPGKYILGARVVDKQRGTNPGLIKMFTREIIGKFVSTLFLGLGFFWAIWDKDSQAWHDKIAGTVVTRTGQPMTRTQAAHREVI